MIVFGSAVTKPDVYQRHAERGIKLAAEPDSIALPRPAVGSIFSNYNALMARLRREGTGGSLFAYVSTEQWLRGLSKKVTDLRGILMSIAKPPPRQRGRMAQRRQASQTWLLSRCPAAPPK